MHAYMLTEGGVDMWPGSPALHVLSGHICLGVGLERVWGRIDESVCLCVSAYMSHVPRSWDKEGAGQPLVQAVGREKEAWAGCVCSLVLSWASQTCIPTPSTDHPQPCGPHFALHSQPCQMSISPACPKWGECRTAHILSPPPPRVHSPHALWALRTLGRVRGGWGRL